MSMLKLIPEALAGGSGSTENPIQNPLNGIDSIPELIGALLRIVFEVGMPILVVAFVWVGFMFVWARGNSTKLAQAKTAFLWTLLGAALVLGAFVISTALETTIRNLGQ